MAASTDIGPAPNWTKTLDNIPKFSSITIAEHLESCGKSDVGEKS